MNENTESRPGVQLASYVLVLVALFLVLQKGLLIALFAGMLVYSLVHSLTPVLGKTISGKRAKMVAVVALSFLIIAVLSAGIWGLVVFFQSEAGNPGALLDKMAGIIDASRDQLPVWIRERLPAGAEALREMIARWLHEHAVEARTLGEEAGRGVARLLIGMIIGAMVALHDTADIHSPRPLARALGARVTNLNDAFGRIVFAQVRISAANTIFTGIYIFIVLPLLGIHLPLSKTLVIITFIAGLLPIIGNLISNTVLVVVALSHSLQVALASLLFLVVIHKLEYFLNARIIGSHINARAWELLIAMLAMEAVFGLPGVVAAPVFYAYVKKELSDQELI
ncbi:AI-2E family transporter [Noviherbaspirillum massiliense]|uniref:AI-2E family transporter n=1 Tax=Noviherbaspirillum massiliense TaxID=1465823 RepID=UPI000474E5F3|nr:AI-2E family transporter [Noviherbaspirillum massiliense]